MDKKGFTLVELLVVISIIGLLSTLAVVSLGSARGKARDAKRMSDIKQVQTALELYYADNSVYPTGTAVELGSTNAAVLDSDSGFNDSPGSGTVYMGQVPKNSTSPTTAGYTYNQTGSGAGYTIDFELEGSVGDFEKGTLQATQDGVKQ